MFNTCFYLTLFSLYFAIESIAVLCYYIAPVVNC